MQYLPHDSGKPESGEMDLNRVINRSSLTGSEALSGINGRKGVFTFFVVESMQKALFCNTLECSVFIAPGVVLQKQDELK